MKIVMPVVAFVFILITSFFISSCDSGSKKQSGQVNITGLWTDSNSAAFKNGYIIFSQEGDQIVFAHYLEYNDTSMVEHGKGKIKDRKVEYDVTVTKVISGWAKSGIHSLELSKDGTTLRGAWKAEGNSGPLVFKRIK